MNYLRKIFSKDEILYTIFLFVSIIVIVTNRIFSGFSNILWIIDIASLCCVLNIIFIAKHNGIFFIFNIISTSILCFTSIYQHLWFNALVCGVFNLPFTIFGLVKWIKNEKKNKNTITNLNSFSKKGKILLCIISMVVIGLFTFILYKLNGNLFYFDAIFSGLCAVGVCLNAFAYIEQFTSFIVADFFGIILYIFLTIQNVNNLSMIFTYFIMLVLNIVGLVKWNKLFKQKNKMENSTSEKIE